MLPEQFQCFLPGGTSFRFGSWQSMWYPVEKYSLVCSYLKRWILFANHTTITLIAKYHDIIPVCLITDAAIIPSMFFSNGDDREGAFFNVDVLPDRLAQWTAVVHLIREKRVRNDLNLSDIIKYIRPATFVCKHGRIGVHSLAQQDLRAPLSRNNTALFQFRTLQSRTLVPTPSCHCWTQARRT